MRSARLRDGDADRRAPGGQGRTHALQFQRPLAYRTTSGIAISSFGGTSFMPCRSGCLALGTPVRGSHRVAEYVAKTRKEMSRLSAFE